MSGVSSTNDSSKFTHYERQFRELQDDMADEKKRIEKRNEDQLAKMEAGYRRELDKQAEAHQRSMELLKEETNESLNRERKSHAYELGRDNEKNRQFTYDAKGRFNHVDSEAKEQQLREMAEAIEHVRYKGDQDRAQMDQIQKQHLEEHANDAERATEQLKQVHTEETDKLRQSIKELSTMNRGVEKQKAEALAKSIRDNENEWLMKQRRLTEGFETDIENLRRANTDTEARMSQKNHESTRNAEDHFTKVVQQQMLDSHQKLKEAEGSFSTEIKNMKKMRAQENDSIQAAHSSRMEAAHKSREDALEAQSKSARDTLNRQRKADEEKINDLQKQLTRQRAPDDSSNISPAAEAVVRKNIVKHYDKSLQAEIDRNREALERVNITNTERQRAMRDDKEEALTVANRENAAQRTNERSLFINQLHESETDKKLALNQMDQQHLRGSEKLTRNYSILLERQRRDYENVIADLKAESTTKLQTERQENSFKMKLLQRAASERQSEVAHEYQRQLADQKVDYDFKIDELKNQARMDLKDAEKRTKQALEDQSKSYEQRIAQLESQAKERERYLSQAHQDELDKVRRSNALLLQKKG